jgi:predicted HAD superfamily phosphohydrolase YqeG
VRTAYHRAAYYRAADLDGLLEKAGELGAKTIVLDIEPLVAYWDNGQEALEEGVARVFAAAAAVPGVAVVCFSTNSARRPAEMPSHPGVRMVYLASARKPVSIAPYAGFPRPGVVIGDQIATDGLLARRLGYAFLHYWPPSAPLGPRLLGYGGRAVRPLLFSG